MLYGFDGSFRERILAESARLKRSKPDLMKEAPSLISKIGSSIFGGPDQEPSSQIIIQPGGTPATPGMSSTMKYGLVALVSLLVIGTVIYIKKKRRVG